MIQDTSSWCFPRRGVHNARAESGAPAHRATAEATGARLSASVGVQTDAASCPTPPAAAATVTFHTGPSMRVALEQCFRSAESEIVGALYCLDDASLVGILCQKAQEGRSVRIVLDEGQVRKPSCSMQLQRMLELI